jgi:hypothetical protein
MNADNQRFPGVDAALELFSRVTVPADVERRLEARLQGFCPQPQRRVRRRFIWASVAFGLAATVLIAWFVAFATQDAWAEVAKTMRSKPWARWTLQIPNGASVPEGFQAPEGWFSAEKHVFAGRANQAVQYLDLRGQEAYDYSPQTKTLNRSLTSDLDSVEVGHFETLLRLVAEGDRALKLPESPIQIVGRTRRDVSDGGRRWAEYRFSCRDSRRTHQDYRVTFRVDPETQLPVEMRSTEQHSPNDPTDERIYAIDYPDVGPADVYDLDVPRDAKVVDRRGARTEDRWELNALLSTYVQARMKPLEPFTATVLHSYPEKAFSDLLGAFRGKDDGREVQVEEVDFEQLMEIRTRLSSGQIARPKDVDPAVWWAQQIEGMKFTPVPRGHLLPHRIGYPRELLTIGTSPVDNPDCRVSLDRKPVSGPPDTVLLRIRIETTVGFNDCFFWIAPERDYLVLRHEIHFSRDHAAWNNSTQIIDKVEQSPSGRWYAAAVRSGRIERHGGDLPAKPVAATADTGREMGPVTTSSYRFLVEFRPHGPTPPSDR